MARKTSAKKAKKKSASRKVATLRRAQGGPERSRGARKPAKKTSQKTVKNSKKTVNKAANAKKAANRAPKKATPVSRAAGLKATATRKAAKTLTTAKRSAAAIKAAGTKKAAAAMPKGGLLTAVKKLATAAVAAGVSAALAPKKKPNLDRPRKTVADVHGIPSSLDLDRRPSSAKSGRAEMRDKLSKNNSGGAAITAGDVDADWQSAESVGDEAPGGDNPTPDQDIVDDIGKALGVTYEDNEELKASDKVIERDKHRWELDPASAEDYTEHDKD